MRHTGLIAAILVYSQSALAVDTVSTRLMTLPLATDIARAAVEACTRAGYQVSAVVVDRSAVLQVAMRSVYASRFTLELAERKANAVVLSGVSSAEFRVNRGDIRDELHTLNEVLLLDGGLPVRAAGTLLGAIGVSGAPGGDKDETCAQAGLDAVEERLEFAD